MRVLIIGSGDTGQHLAEKLCDEKHDVVLIDSSDDALGEVQSQLDIMTVEGEGASPRILHKAEIHKADLLVAVTNSDEVNLLACIIANAAGVPNKVARVSNLDYLHPPDDLDIRKAGIDLIVSQKEECAQELFHMLRMPGTIEAVDLLEGRILGVGIKVHMDSPLLRGSLREFPKPELLQAIRFITVVRGSEKIVPRGDTRFMIGDDIYFVGRREDVAQFLEWAWPDHTGFEKVVIGGGGDLGLRLAQLLEAASINAVLIEENEERAQDCSATLKRSLVIHGDTLDQETLENAGIVEQTAFVAVTNSDENNIIACLLAEKMKASFTIARVMKPEYAPIVDSLSLLDRVVSPPLSMINAILHFVRGTYVKEAALFHRLPGELLDLIIPPGGKWANKAIKDLKVPDGVTIASILRDDEVFVATGDLVLAEGDRVVLFALPHAIGKLKPLFRK